MHNVMCSCNPSGNRSGLLLSCYESCTQLRYHVVVMSYNALQLPSNGKSINKALPFSERFYERRVELFELKRYVFFEELMG